MKPGGLKLLERSPCKLTPRYKADVSRRCERASKWSVTCTQSISGHSPAAGKAEGMVTVTPPAQRALALIYRCHFGMQQHPIQLWPISTITAAGCPPLPIPLARSRALFSILLFLWVKIVSLGKSKGPPSKRCQLLAASPRNSRQCARATAGHQLCSTEQLRPTAPEELPAPVAAEALTSPLPSLLQEMFYSFHSHISKCCAAPQMQLL